MSINYFHILHETHLTYLSLLYKEVIHKYISFLLILSLFVFLLYFS